MTVNVLGTDYTVEKFKRAYDECLCDCDGYCDKTSKRIVVAEKDSVCNLDDFECHQKKVLRHEIVHAFLYESGLWQSSYGSKCWAQNEEMVDWIAIQEPKLNKAFKEAGCDG